MKAATRKTIRVAFQGEPGAFSEAAAVQLLGAAITTVPRPTFEAAFRAIGDGAADALLAPVENSLAGSVVRVYDLLLENDLGIVAEIVHPIEHHLIGCPGSILEDIRSVASHPMALAQCEKFFLAHPHLKRVPAEDTAGSVREVLSAGDKTRAAIAGSRAAEHYHGLILAPGIQDNAENFTRFVLLIPVLRGGSGKSVRTSRSSSLAVSDLMVELRVRQKKQFVSGSLLKMSVALRLAHKPGALLAALEPFARHSINLMKIESRPIHGTPWIYQFFLDLVAESPAHLDEALPEVRRVTSFLRILGLYPVAKQDSDQK